MRNSYICLQQQEFQMGDYNLVPIRMEDRYRIMEWRNDQIYHLRQQEKLNSVQQDRYFREEVFTLFDQINPKQILFSMLEKGECIGYGGLVHINWGTRSAEISFLMDTTREHRDFSTLWITFLTLIESVAFQELQFNRIFTYSYELRPHLYKVLKQLQFKEEKRISKASQLGTQWIDALIHSKQKDNLRFREATIDDKQRLFEWTNDPMTRLFSLRTKPVRMKEHSNWFDQKLADPSVSIYIFVLDQEVGVVRVELQHQKKFISFQVAPNARGLGLGYRMIEAIGLHYAEHTLYADVLENNIASHKIFKANHFELDFKYESLGRQVSRYKFKKV